jgi:hypothetical protein
VNCYPSNLLSYSSLIYISLQDNKLGTYSEVPKQQKSKFFLVCFRLMISGSSRIRIRTNINGSGRIKNTLKRFSRDISPRTFITETLCIPQLGTVLLWLQVAWAYVGKYLAAYTKCFSLCTLIKKAAVLFLTRCKNSFFFIVKGWQILTQSTPWHGTESGWSVM